MTTSYHVINTPRLRIRSIQPEEVRQWWTIETDPLNDKFDAIPDPKASEEKLKGNLKKAIIHGVLPLFIIAKDENQYSPQNLPLMVNGGVVIGYIEITLMPEKEVNGGKTSGVGGYIHHPFYRRGYWREAFTHVIDYAFDRLARKEMLIETNKANEPFKGLMKKFGLEDLQWSSPGEKCK
jgi:RimJ/RimL family protein N-acetyltransferase